MPSHSQDGHPRTDRSRPQGGTATLDQPRPATEGCRTPAPPRTAQAHREHAQHPTRTRRAEREHGRRRSGGVGWHSLDRRGSGRSAVPGRLGHAARGVITALAVGCRRRLAHRPGPAPSTRYAPPAMVRDRPWKALRPGASRDAATSTTTAPRRADQSRRDGPPQPQDRPYWSWHDDNHQAALHAHPRARLITIKNYASPGPPHTTASRF